MLSTLKNSDGYIIAYLEWEIVNAQGEFENDGEYCYIQDYWIHQIWRFDNKIILGDLSRQIADHKFSKNMKWVYWNTEKHNYRKSKTYLKEKFIGGLK